MPQRAQIIDITKSYLPADPNSFVQNLVNTDREDGEEKTFPLLPYEGYNFLPTAYGYKSYFGTNSQLALNALPSRAQHILLYQLPTFKSRLIALCEDGIWVGLATGEDPDWIRLITDTFDANVYEEWTWCVIENILYMYKQGKSYVYKTGIGTITGPEIPAVPTIPAVLGGAVGSPRTYQTFTETVGTTGYDTNFFWNFTYRISYQYFIGTAFSAASTAVTLVPTHNEPSIDIAVSGSPPGGVANIRVYIEDVDAEVLLYRDFPLSAFPLSLPDYAGFTSGAYQTATLEVEGTPEIPGTPAIPGYELTNDLAITGFAPSFLNMAGQMGIFKAGLRLGFWDSANSVSWSSNLDLADFTPSIETLAGNTIFGAIIGRIVTCRGHGEGFLVYSTKSIAGANFSQEGNLLWDAKSILSDTGISHSRAVTNGQSDAEHFVFSNAGIIKVGKYTAITGKHEIEWIVPELYDLLKESRDPVSLAILQDRYLCFSVISPDYIYGRQSFYTGVADPHTFNIDWYIPSTDDPLPTKSILPEQMWEILRKEMSGQSETKRSRMDNRFWVPKYTTTLDRMDTAFYARWMDMKPGENLTGLISYAEEEPYLNTIPLNLTSGLLATHFNPPLAAGHYGTGRDFTGIRAFYSSPGADIYNNNEALIFAQEDEWDGFKKHQLVSMEKLSNVSDIQEDVVNAHTIYTVANGWTIISTDPTLGSSYATEVTKAVGGVITGDGNNEWLTTEGPTEYAAKEVILRRVFNKKFRITQGVKSVYNQTQLSGSLSSLNFYPLAGYASPTIGTVIASNLTTQAENYSSEATLLSAVSASLLPGTDLLDRSVLIAGFPQVFTYSFIGPLSTRLTNADSNYKFLWIYYQRIVVKVYTSLTLTTLFSTHTYTLNPVDGSGASIHTYAGTWDTPPIGEALTVFNATLDENVIMRGLLKAVSAQVTTTYTYEEITENAGYSQLRMLVTHWDLIEPGLYGQYKIITTVPAEAMTPKVWNNHFPDDKGIGRNQLWSFSEYTAQALTNLQEGSIGNYNPYLPDPTATPNLVITGYDTVGITSAHSSFTLPGATFLLQTGSIETSYPTFLGALVFDLQLKKWGKFRGDHKLLLETTPSNTSPFGTITYSDLGANAGIFSADGFVKLFDSQPTDSWIRYGKIGFYRLGMTNLLEVKVSMRFPSNFAIHVESSMDGKVLDLNTAESFYYLDQVLGEALPDISARWHTVKISGNYDLTGLEIRAIMAGRR